MDDIVSFVAGAALIVVSALVVWNWRNAVRHPDLGVHLLALGLILSFASHGLNAAWWTFLLRGFSLVGWEAGTAFIQAWGGYMDGLMKGLGAIGGALHLWAYRNTKVAGVSDQ